jgi:hypothetical protein
VYLGLNSKITILLLSGLNAKSIPNRNIGNSSINKLSLSLFVNVCKTSFSWLVIEGGKIIDLLPICAVPSVRFSVWATS